MWLLVSVDALQANSLWTHERNLDLYSSDNDLPALCIVLPEILYGQFISRCLRRKTHQGFARNGRAKILHLINGV